MGKLYRRFLDCGHTPELFWSVSANEAIDMIESHDRVRQEREQEEMRRQTVLLDLFGANLIEKVAGALGRGDGMKFSLTEYFPGLFPKEQESSQDGEKDKKAALSPEMQLYKAQRIHHAYKVNKARKEKGMTADE